MSKKKLEQPITRDYMQNLLAEQSGIILGAVDQRFAKVDKRLEGLESSFNSKLALAEVRIVADVDKKLVAMELRINQKFDKLTTTLDKFLKRLTDLKDEFEIMKHDINQLKKIIQEKLGVNFSSPH